MMTDAQIKSMPDEARSAWLSSLQGDEKCIVHCSQTSKLLLVLASVLKRYLAGDIPTEYRFRFLQWLEKFEKLSDGWLTADAIAMIDPMCDDGYEIVTEARKLGGDSAKERWPKAFAIFKKHEIFSAFVALNPSLLTVLRNRANAWGDVQ
jgi:hypothetical protein